MPTLGSALMASVSQPGGRATGPLGEHALGPLEVVERGHLEGQRVAVDDDHVVPAQLDQRRVVGGPDAAVA